VGGTRTSRATRRSRQGHGEAPPAELDVASEVSFKLRSCSHGMPTGATSAGGTALASASEDEPPNLGEAPTCAGGVDSGAVRAAPVEAITNACTACAIGGSWGVTASVGWSAAEGAPRAATSVAAGANSVGGSVRWGVARWAAVERKHAVSTATASGRAAQRVARKRCTAAGGRQEVKG